MNTLDSDTEEILPVYINLQTQTIGITLKLLLNSISASGNTKSGMT